MAWLSVKCRFFFLTLNLLSASLELLELDISTKIHYERHKFFTCCFFRWLKDAGWVHENVAPNRLYPSDGFLYCGFLVGSYAFRRAEPVEPHKEVRHGRKYTSTQLDLVFGGCGNNCGPRKGSSFRGWTSKSNPLHWAEVTEKTLDNIEGHELIEEEF